MKKSMIVVAAGFAVGLIHAGESIPVANEKLVTLTASSAEMTAATPKQADDYPVSVVAPAFWLDCMDTAGWGLSTENGQTVVTNIPSKAGSTLAGVRWLTTRPDGGDWTGWGGLGLEPPFLVENASALGGKAYLDFGNAGSRRALSFNPALLSAGATAETNALINIGTVIAVWGSDVRNGGHLLGGGASYSFGWHRAGNPITGSSIYAASYYWYNRIMNENAQPAARNGRMWQDGNLCTPTFSSYNGGWEVLSLACTSATAESNGIGINDKRRDMSGVSGGQEVAEVLIYDTVLTREQIERVEMYLEQKWFGRNRTGFNGAARVEVVNASTDNLATIVDVPTGEALEIGRIQGGSQPQAKMTKTGGGTLMFVGEGARNYTGELVLDAGKVEFPSLRATPTLAQLPARLYARFDPSETSSMEVDAATKAVSRLGNLSTADHARAFNRPFSLRQNVAARRPVLLEDELGEGLSVVDFGKNGTSGAYMCFSTNETEVAGVNNASTLYGVQTIVAVLGVQEGGGNLFDNATFKRASVDTRSHRNAVLSNALGGYTPNLNASEFTMWSDGCRWDATVGYERSGYQVVAFQVAGENISQLLRMSDGGTYAGGARVGELLMWNRSLTEREILDAQAYLSAKWLKKAIPGYARTDSEFAPTDIQRLSVPAGKRVEIAVGAGCTARIGNLSVAGELVKTGSGTLEVEEAAFRLAGRVVCGNNSVKIVGVRDVTSSAEIAPGATVHVDASDASSIRADSDLRMQAWGGQKGALGLYSGANLSPHVTTAANGCNGKPVVDFGRWGVGNGGRYMPLDRQLRSMRSIYAVIKYYGGDNKLGFLFSDGASVKNPWAGISSIDFHPGTGGSGWNGRFMGTDFPTQKVFDGACWTNGVNTLVRNFIVATNEFQLLELHPSAGVAGSYMGVDSSFDGGRMGGFAIAELVIYEHPLSEREKVATRNALMRKWLDPAYSNPLPPVPEKTTLVSPELPVSGNQTIDVEADIEKVRVTGGGTLTKTGTGTLTVRDLSAFDGRVNVEEGTLSLPDADPYASPALPASGIVYHADSMKGITATTNADGVVCVSEWASRVGTVKAVRSGGETTYQTLVFDPDLGYRPTVDMNGHNACFMWQDGAGNDVNIGGLKSIFWMVGSQNGGGFLLGGGRKDDGEIYHAWHRGQYTATDPDTGATKNYIGTTNLCPILHDASHPNLLSAKWWKNGTSITRSATLSGKWDQLSMVVKDDDSPVNADGLAFDGRSRKPSGATQHENNGHQRLAELICYDRRVTDEEREQIECYLRCKWNNGMHDVATNALVHVADGAMLDLGDNAQAFAGIAGDGTIDGSVTARMFEAVCGGTSLTVSGTLTIAANPVVTVTGVTAKPEGVLDIPIVAASAFEGVENLTSAVIEGVPADVRARLRIRGGKLVLRLGANGMAIIVR